MAGVGSFTTSRVAGGDICSGMGDNIGNGCVELEEVGIVFGAEVAVISVEGCTRTHAVTFSPNRLTKTAN